MPLSTLNIGDTVQLKSGGPIMTVEGENHEGGIVCQWFDNNGELRAGGFPEQSLNIYTAQ